MATILTGRQLTLEIDGDSYSAQTAEVTLVPTNNAETYNPHRSDHNPTPYYLGTQRPRVPRLERSDLSFRGARYRSNRRNRNLVRDGYRLRYDNHRKRDPSIPERGRRCRLRVGNGPHVPSRRYAYIHPRRLRRPRVYHSCQ